MRTDQQRLDDLFLGLTIDTTSDFEKIQQNQNFSLLSDAQEYSEDKTLRAKFVGKSNLYSFADSIHIKIWPSNTYGAFKDGQWTEIVLGKELVVSIFVNDSLTLLKQYYKLTAEIEQALRINNPTWTNHSGAGTGTYFVSKNSDEAITIGKDFRHRRHLRLARNYLEK